MFHFQLKYLKPMHFLIASICSLLLFANCSPKNLSGTVTQESISGSVLPLSQSSLKNQSVRPLACTLPLAHLYEMNSAGLKVLPEITQAQVNPDGTYSLKLKKNALKDKTFLIEVTGCDTFLTRIVTDSRLQDVSFGTSLISWVSEGPQASELQSADKTKLAQLFKLIETSASLSQAYSLLLSDVKLQELFAELFAVSPTTLQDVAPVEGIFNVDSTGSEGTPLNFSMTTNHWSATYQSAFIWKFDSTSIGTNSNVSFIPGQNSQGTHSITVYYGKDGGAGVLDLTKPYKSKSFNLLVGDSFPATVPLITLTSQAYTSNPNVTVSINTGASMINCQSFSKLAIVEDFPTMPLFESDFNLNCSQSISQSITTQLLGVDGTHTLYLWARDSAGKISLVPKTVSVTLDRANPIITVNAPVSNERVNGAFTVSGSCNQGNTVSATGDITTTSTTCSLGIFSLSVTPSLGEGVKNLTFSQTDLAGNQGSTALAVTRDDTSPALTISSPTALTETEGALTLTGACGAATGDSSTVTLTGSFTGSPIATACSAGGYSQNITLTGVDGNKTITIVQADSAGNSTNVSRIFIKDTVAPLLSISSPLENSVMNSAFTLAGACETGISISLSGPATGTFSCTAGNFSSSLTLTGTDGAKSISLTQTDSAGNSTVASRIFIKDTAAPQITNFNLNGGAISATNNYFQVTSSITDSTSKVTKFCLKYNSVAAPISSDTCWVPVQNPNPGLVPAQVINLNNFVYQVGFGSGAYKVSIWAVDEAGNISTMTNTGTCTSGIDCKTMSYAPGAPPSVSNILVASTSAPTQPQSNGDLTMASGTSVFVKWTASSTVGLTANPVSLFYTTDDITFSPIPGASALLNGVNGSCVVNEPSTTADDLATGCFVWPSGSPTSSYFKIKVLVQDTNSMATSATSQSLNVATSLRMIAGNTDPGLNSSATSAMFFNNLYYSAVSDNMSLVIAKNGTVFFRDVLRGLLFVDPANGVQKIFIPKTGISSGDGGPISAATLNDPIKIALDYDNNLLIIDYDRIRKVDLNVSPMTISTFIGGGTSDLDDVSPLDVMINYTGPIGLEAPSQHSMYNALIPAPNGDLYFHSAVSTHHYTPSGGYKMRHYKKSLNQVTSYAPSGTGYSANGSVSLSSCIFFKLGFAFDLATKLPTSTIGSILGNGGTACASDGFVNLNSSTGVALGNQPLFGAAYYTPSTGMDGNIYFVSRLFGLLRKWNPLTLSMNTIAGTGSPGTCVDGTVATSCAMDPLDIFVTSQGTVYFMDRGRLRTIDEQNKIVTVMGQSFSHGDLGQALSARFNTVGNIAHWTDGSVDKVIVLDQQELRFRELSIGGSIDTIAGTGTNGTFDFTNLAKNQNIITSGSGVSWDDFVASPLDGTIYYNNANSGIARLNRTTNKWQAFVGGGTTSYAAADGLTGPNIDTTTTGYPAHLLGISNNEVVASFGRFNPGISIIEDQMMKRYALANGAQSSLMGTLGFNPDLSSCTDGSASVTCGIAPVYGIEKATRSTYDSYFAGGRWTISQRGFTSIKVIDSGGIVNTLTTLNDQANNHAYVHDAGQNIVYYCSMTDSKIHKKDITSGIETILAWPVASMKCSGRSLVYVPSRNSLIFIYTQNGLYGVAEHTSL